MGRLLIGVAAFAAGFGAGALFVKWYISTHPGGTIIAAAGEKIFGEGSKGAAIVSSVGHTIDDVFMQ